MVCFVCFMPLFKCGNCSCFFSPKLWQVFGLECFFVSEVSARFRRLAQKRLNSLDGCGIPEVDGWSVSRWGEPSPYCEAHEQLQSVGASLWQSQAEKVDETILSWNETSLNWGGVRTSKNPQEYQRYILAATVWQSFGQKLWELVLCGSCRQHQTLERRLRTLQIPKMNFQPTVPKFLPTFFGNQDSECVFSPVAEDNWQSISESLRTWGETVTKAVSDPINTWVKRIGYTRISSEWLSALERFLNQTRIWNKLWKGRTLSDWAWETDLFRFFALFLEVCSIIHHHCSRSFQDKREACEVWCAILSSLFEWFQ